MANTLEAYAHLAGQTVRTGWFATLYGLTNRRVSKLSSTGERIQLTKPMPKLWPLVQGVLSLQALDARNIRNGVYPAPAEDDGSLTEHLESVRNMLADLPQSNARREAGLGEEAAALPEAEGLPAYYAQNFHFQSGGWLTAESARIYDVQVETLFMGSAGAMRRQAIPPIADFIKGQDQRRFHLADIACGSGRFLGQLAQAFPAMRMTGIDLSRPYLDEAARYLEGRRSIDFQQANAEDLPLPSNSLDIVTNVYLFHELPFEVRRRVTSEIARVLKPGGLFVFVDSLQWGDVPDYDALLEAFPQRFHEPYYMNYIEDDLSGRAGLFQASGLNVDRITHPFLSKVVVCRKANG